MALDPSIPLQAVAPDPMQKISGMLNVANNALTYKRNQATFGADVAQRQAESSSAQSGATVSAANVQPLIQEQAAKTSTAQTGAQSAQFGLQKDYMGTALQTASGLMNDPRIAAQGPNYDPQAATKAILEAKNQMIAKGVPAEQAELATAPLVMQIHTPGAVQQMLKNTLTGQLAPQGQAGAIAPSGVGVTNGIQSAQVNTNPLAAPVGQAIPGTTQTQLVPLGQQQGTGSDINGNPLVTRKDAYGNIQAPAAMPGSGQSSPPPMISYPAGESAATKAELEQESLGAKNAALTAPVLHDINRTILSEAGNFSTGSLGALTQKIASATGYNLSGESATGYNLLGKMLERSAATAAQSMGPHTNAGLESAVRQNGSLEYTPDAIKTIARLNDSLTTGAEKYAQGLQTAISNSGNGVFAKRQFDQQWGQNADVNALKFLTATKTGDQEGAQQVLKSIGGPGSVGAKTLAQHLKNLQSLSTQGHL